MLKTLWFLFVAVSIAASITWMLDHNGSITINWLGYEAKTDILTAVLLVIFFTLLVFAISYASARVLAIKLPRFSKLFKKKKNDE